MYKFVVRSLFVSAVLSAAAFVHAGTYKFIPNPANLDNLDHYKYYSWGIQWAKPENEVITEAVLEIKNIYDWQVEEGDHLYTHLLDNPPAGFKTYNDDQGGGDNWDGAGPLVGDYQDPQGGSPRGYNLVYRFSELSLLDDLDKFVKDGKFGFGFDPDCHYFNDGASFTVTTESVPEPFSIAAMGAGLIGLARRRFVKKS
ncbi:MAG: PEP-CTERM sorting domain-containing protein [Armatimonadetes bacterium]|nr:PEP-CTERM sorting domain-containing protein [Armatimonadota bacterium]